MQEEKGFPSRMTLLSDDRSPNAAARAAKSRLRAVVAIPLACVAVILFGFVAFLAQVRNAETGPERQADGIVVLTGGSSRVSDAMELLAAGYGKRLLISGVHPTSTVSDISRSVQESQALFTCCVDLDRSAVSTRSNASETRRWARDRSLRSLIIVTSNYHMPRALVELSHAMPDVTLVAYPVIGDKWRDEPWWSSGAAVRLLWSEYMKYLAANVRVHVDRFVKTRDAEPAPKEQQESANAARN